MYLRSHMNYMVMAATLEKGLEKILLSLIETLVLKRVAFHYNFPDQLSRSKLFLFFLLTIKGSLISRKAAIKKMAEIIKSVRISIIHLIVQNCATYC